MTYNRLVTDISGRGAVSDDLVIRPINILALCAGIGGLDLGLKRATGGSARTVCYVEVEAFAAAVLVARMQDQSLDTAPVWSDVKTFDGTPWRGKVDCITGGFPCQPFSAAGKRKGKDDPRHLWPYFVDIIAAIEPSFCFFENVPGLINLGLDQVLEDLEGLGYKTEVGLFSAAEVGAPHIRKRIFMLAHANGSSGWKQLWGRQICRPNKAQDTPDIAANGCSRNLAYNAAHANGGAIWHAEGANRSSRIPPKPQHDGTEKSVANADGLRQPGRRSSKPHAEMAAAKGCGAKWALSEKFVDGQPERCVGNVAYGLSSGAHNAWANGWGDRTPRVTIGEPNRIDRLRALGNAVVPQVAELAFKTLWNQLLSSSSSSP